MLYPALYMCGSVSAGHRTPADTEMVGMRNPLVCSLHAPVPIDVIKSLTFVCFIAFRSYTLLWIFRKQDVKSINKMLLLYRVAISIQAYSDAQVAFWKSEHLNKHN